MVVRSATTSYCALGMYDAVWQEAHKVREIFEEACSSIQSWDNDFEMTHKIPSLCKSIDEFQKSYYTRQKPLLMQNVVENTKENHHFLADQAFDIVIWSDYAFSRLFIDSSYEVTSTMSRPMRASARISQMFVGT
mgnify:CR=1 FL=1